MKWIGQHIFDLISRLRNDVYLEGLSNAGADTDKFLVIDTNNKVAFRTGTEVLSDSGGVNGSTLSNIGDVTIDTKTNGDLLKWNGSAWINSRTLSSIQSVSFVNNAAGIQTLANDVLSIGSSGSIKLSLDTDQAQSASVGTFSIVNGGGTIIYSLDENGNIKTKGQIQDNSGTGRIDFSDTNKTKIDKNLQLLGSSPATLSGPDSNTLKVESASDLEFKIASGGASSKSFKFYNNTSEIASINASGVFSGTITSIGNLTGDVTSSNRATTIANDAVTYAKMQNLATGDRVLGATSAGVIGETQVVTDMIATDAVTEDKLANSLLAEIDANTSKVTDKHHAHDQGNAAASWVVTHNLNKFPSVTVVDTAGSVVLGQVTYNSASQVTLTFRSSFAGKAYFN